MDKDLKTIACAYFIGGYEYSTTGRVYDYTSVKVSLSRASLEKLNSYSDDLSDESILSKIDGYVNSKEELDKYASWFYHPKGTSVSTQSLVPEESSDFIDSPVVDFSDGINVESAQSDTSFSDDSPDLEEVPEESSFNSSKQTIE